jgi:hypothetical protein
MAESLVKSYADRSGRRLSVHASNLLGKLFYIERDIRNKIKYGLSAPTSASLIFIDPLKITMAIHPNASVRADSGRVKGGDWDLATRKIDEIRKVLGVKEHILHATPWRKTAAWQQCLIYLKRRDGSDGIRRMVDIERRYQELDEFIAKVVRLREAAFQTRQEIRPGNFREAAGIYVNIDRNGNLLFGMRGCHRLAVAQALGLRCIPVQLGAVHSKAVTDGTWKKNIMDPVLARSIRAAAEYVGNSEISSNDQATTLSPIPTKQRYDGKTKASSIEYNANKQAHWNGEPVEKFKRLIPILPGNSIVEIGAAEGILSLTLAPYKKRVRAIDITPIRHEKALELKERWIELGRPVQNCEMVLGDILRDPELIQGFDTLVASRVIYYFGTHLDEFMDSVRTSVENVCFIGNPVRTELYNQGKTGKLGIYAQYATIPGMIELVERHGFKVTNVDPSLDPLIIATRA